MGCWNLLCVCLVIGLDRQLDYIILPKTWMPFQEVDYFLVHFSKHGMFWDSEIIQTLATLGHIGANFVTLAVTACVFPYVCIHEVLSSFINQFLPMACESCFLEYVCLCDRCKSNFPSWTINTFQKKNGLFHWNHCSGPGADVLGQLETLYWIWKLLTDVSRSMMRCRYRWRYSQSWFGKPRHQILQLCRLCA